MENKKINQRSAIGHDTLNDDVLLSVVELLKKGELQKSIAMKLNYSERQIRRIIAILRRNGIIKKKGYGVYEAIGQIGHDTTGRSKVLHEIRGHGFVFNLKIPRFYHWKQRKDFLNKNNIKYKDLKYCQSIEIYDNKVWLSDKTITIYLKREKSFTDKTADLSEKKAIDYLFKIIKRLENIFNISLEINKAYQFTTSRKHFARINDTLAKKCNGTRTKIFLRLQDGIFLIDNSYNMNEAETQGNESKKYMDQIYLKFLDDLFKYKYTAEDTHKLYTLQEMYADNIKKHMDVLNELDSKMVFFNKFIEEFKKGNYSIK